MLCRCNKVYLEGRMNVALISMLNFCAVSYSLVFGVYIIKQNSCWNSFADGVKF